MNDVRVRIAPSPTGIPHIGNTTTALFNFLWTRHNKGKFILRIEDTDQVRIVKGAKEAITEILDWLRLTPDETYTQSERLTLYQQKAQQLVKNGLAKKEDGAVRFIIPKDKTISWQDGVGNKHISFESQDIENFIILKSDGFPTYHLANVVDDYEMKISHVIRGNEWISSTPKHILLYEAFGWGQPVFAHLPLILGPDKTKLSKRHGAKSVLDYRGEGYLEEALLNFMALLGWSPGQDREIMSLEEMISLFDLKDINTASPTFDIQKLTWLNGYYIRQLSPAELKSKIKNQKEAKLGPSGAKLQLKIQNVDEAALDKLIVLAQTRMKTLNDFYGLVLPFFGEQKITLNEKERKVAAKLKKELLAIEQWNNEAILNVLQNILKSEGVKMSVIYKILTGQETGLPLSDTLEILGKERTISKLAA